MKSIGAGPVAKVVVILAAAFSTVILAAWTFATRARVAAHSERVANRVGRLEANVEFFGKQTKSIEDEIEPTLGYGSLPKISTPIPSRMPVPDWTALELCMRDAISRNLSRFMQTDPASVSVFSRPTMLDGTIVIRVTVRHGVFTLSLVEDVMGAGNELQLALDRGASEFSWWVVRDCERCSGFDGDDCISARSSYVLVCSRTRIRCYYPN